MNWIKCADKMPEQGVPVIAYIPNFNGGNHARRIRAIWVEADTIEADEDFEHEYLPAGWYEYGEYSESMDAVSDAITHWRPLPDKPEGGE